MNKIGGALGGKQKEVITHVSRTTDVSHIHRLALEMGVEPEDAKFFIRIVCDAIAKSVVEEGVCNIRSLGTFYLQPMKKARYYDKKQENFVKVPLRYVVRFKASGNVEALANNKVASQLDKLVKESKDKNEQAAIH